MPVLGLSASNNLQTVQSAVFPLSDASISSNSDKLYSVWLYDDPTRSTINRSVAVFSVWDGVAWIEPKPIADDGTGDFHPQVLTF